VWSRDVYTSPGPAVIPQQVMPQFLLKSAVYNFNDIFMVKFLRPAITGSVI
jgi:hypothetical protein